MTQVKCIPLWRRNIGTIIFWTVAVWAMVQPYTGFLIFLLAPFSLIYALLKLLFTWRKPELRANYLLLLCLISLACAIVILANHLREAHVRKYADEAILALEQFTATQGHSPKTLATIDPAKFSQESLREKGIFYGLPNDGKPFIFYRDTLMPYDRWHYDFEKKEWIFFPD